MATQTRQNHSLPVQEYFAQVQPNEFPGEIEQRWESASAIKDRVKQLVQQDELQPMDGVAIIACVTGQLFGYQQFHGQASPADLARSLQNQIR